VVTCGPDVPIGKYTTDLFEKAGVDVTPKSYEADVKAIVSKVTLGEADAGIVYATDVKAAGDKAAGVEIPDELNVVATYPIAVTKAAKNVGTADAFVAFVLGEAGQQILAAAGFSAP
jgi:molybdate transport system substrate-binding protein